MFLTINLKASEISNILYLLNLYITFRYKRTKIIIENNNFFFTENRKKIKILFFVEC